MEIITTTKIDGQCHTKLHFNVLLINISVRYKHLSICSKFMDIYEMV